MGEICDARQPREWTLNNGTADRVESRRSQIGPRIEGWCSSGGREQVAILGVGGAMKWKTF